MVAGQPGSSFAENRIKYSKAIANSAGTFSPVLLAICIIQGAFEHNMFVILLLATGAALCYL